MLRGGNQDDAFGQTHLPPLAPTAEALRCLSESVFDLRTRLQLAMETMQLTDILDSPPAQRMRFCLSDTEKNLRFLAASTAVQDDHAATSPAPNSTMELSAIDGTCEGGNGWGKDGEKASTGRGARGLPLLRLSLEAHVRICT